MAKLPYTIPYDPDFLGGGFQVPHPRTCCKGKLLNRGQIFDYIHFSLVMHQDRRSALYTAHNIDVSQKRSASRTGWDLDPRMDAGDQTGPDAYSNNPWDRGHLVRRDAVVWGSQEEAQSASDSTFYYTVSALQHSSFNQSNSKWLGLENWILQKAGSFATRLCVFTGPIYTDVDGAERGYRIPAAFWKIVVLRDPTADGQDLAALAFVMKQNEDWRAAGSRALTNLEPYHVSIAEIEAYTGLDFGNIADVDEFDWRQIRFRNRALLPPIPVNGPDDILFSGDRRRSRGVRALRRLSSTDELIDAKNISRSIVKAAPAKKDCSCKDHTMNLEEEISALKAQTTSLTEIVETLMENNHGNFNERSMGSLRKLMSRIIGGQMVLPGAFPECVAVGDDTGYFCTGILVHKKVVLTAAHCADLPITKVFLRGRQISNLGSGEVRAVERVIVHPQYSSFQVPQHDVSVLILSEESTVDPVAIASKQEVANDDSLVLVGFGSDTPDGLSGFGTKRKVNVALTNTSGFSEADVLDIQTEHGYDVNFEFHGGDFRSGRDTCNGDSGGPAYIITTDGTTKVAGLTSRAANSFIDPCGDGGIYTLIDAYSFWLHEVTEGLVGTEEVTVDDAPIDNNGGIYLSAALPNPEGTDFGNEWIEITNNGLESINLENYRLEDKQGGRLPLDGTINSGATQRVIIPENNPIKLANSGDEIKLLNDDLRIHEVSYSNAGSGQVIIFESPYELTTPIDDPVDNLVGNNDCNDPNPNPGGHGDCQGEIDPDFTPGANPC